MAEQQNVEQVPIYQLELPQLLILRPPPVFVAFHGQFSNKFNLLKAYESPPPPPISSSPPTPSSVPEPVQSPPTPPVPSTLNNPEHRSQPRPPDRVPSPGDIRRQRRQRPFRRRRGCGGRAQKVSAGNRCECALGSKLYGKRVGIVGLGSIGSEVTKRLKPFGCNISFTSRTKKPSVPYPFYPNLQELASNSDILIICCALIVQTGLMVDREVMIALGKQGIIVNIGRGAIIDERELVQCLVQGEIAGAGLDVLKDEA